jgi:hypothetical protein
MLIFMKLYVVMRIKMFKNSNNYFKHQFLMHIAYVLGTISHVEYSYRSVN